MKALRLGTMAGLIAAAITAAAAQDASPRTAGDGCSMLGCLLHPRGDAAPSSQAAAPQPSSPQPPAPQPTAAPAAAPEPAASEAAAKPKPKAAVILAADAVEQPRLKVLAAARPRHRLRIVPARAEEAELALQPTLEAAPDAKSIHLYSEVLHVVAGASVKTLDDLRDKQVSFGPTNGAAAVVARQAFAAAGITVKETPLEVSNALDGLATGDIDAIAVLAPQPAPLLGRLRSTSLHLVDWPESAAMPAGAHSQTLPATAYPRLAKNETRVLTVDAVLRLTPRGEKSAAARGFFASLKQQTAALSRHGFDRIGDAGGEVRQGRAVAKEGRKGAGRRGGERDDR